MNWGRIAKGAAGVVGVVAAARVDPGLGAAAAAAIGGGGTAKIAGKLIESRLGVRPHKLAGPLAAAGVPAALASLGAIDLTRACDVVARVCADPEQLAAVIGALVVFLHQVVGGAGKVRGSPGAG